MGGMTIHKSTTGTSKTEAEAQVFIAENEPLLERAAPATLHRIILHGTEIAEKLSDEVVAEMNETARVLNETAAVIRDDATSPTRIQELEEERMRVQAALLESTKKETFEALSKVIERAMMLRREREASAEFEGPVFTTKLPEQPKRGFLGNLFGR
jgi:hypothetical protein